MSSYSELLGYTKQLERRLAQLERQEIGVNVAGGDHGTLSGLGDDDHSIYLLASAAGGRTAFGTNWTDLTDGGPTTLHTHGQYLDTSSASWLDLSDGGATTLHKHDHGGQDGLGDDDHTLYLLASAAGGRTAFGTNWLDLSDGGATTLHKHDHGGQDGLGDDDHSIYALLSGRSGGQTLIGGTAANDDITIKGTSNATKTTSFVLLQPDGGKVGIGVAAASWALHVEENTAGDGNVAYFSNPNNSVSARSASVILATNVYAHTFLRQNGGGDTQTLGGAVDTVLMNNWTTSDLGHLHLGTNNAIQMTVRHGGNVGIGTTDPAEKLHVSGDLAIYKRFYTTYYGNYVNFGYTTWYGYFGLNIYADNAGNLKRATAGYSGRGTGMMFGDNIEFMHTPAGATVDATVTPTVDMRIDYSTGHVGIGTGTNAAADRLQVSGGNLLLDNAQYYKAKNSAGTAIELLGIDGSNNVYMGAIANAGAKVIIREDGSDVITLHGANVGIGTGSPNGKLQVEGRVGISTGVNAVSAQLYVNQDSTTGTIPVLRLTQNDLSEEFIYFNASVGTGNPIDTVALGTYYGKVRVSVNGTFKWLALYN